MQCRLHDEFRKPVSRGVSCISEYSKVSIFQQSSMCPVMYLSEPLRAGRSLLQHQRARIERSGSNAEKEMNRGQHGANS